MLNDFNGTKKVYLACGYTDLRRGIDGLATIVEQQFQLNPCSDRCFCFVAEEQTESRLCIWNEMDFCYLTNAWKKANFNGLEARVKH